MVLLLLMRIVVETSLGILELSRDVQIVIQSLGESISRRRMSSLLERHVLNQTYRHYHNF